MPPQTWTKVGKKPQSDIDTFAITQKGLGTLRTTHSFAEPLQLTKFRLHTPNIDKVDYAQLATFELMLELERQGWQSMTQRASRKVLPYKNTTECDKVWYYHKTINRYYLQVLLRTEELHHRGFSEVFHFQSCAYYKSLLTLPDSMLNQVKPWQPHSFYKLLQQNARVSKRGPATATSSKFDLDGDAGWFPLNTTALIVSELCVKCLIT